MHVNNFLALQPRLSSCFLLSELELLESWDFSLQSWAGLAHLSEARMKDVQTRQLGGLEWESLCNISAVIIPSRSCVYIKYNCQIFIQIISIIAIPSPQFVLSARKHGAGEAYARPINSLFFTNRQK